MPNPYSLRFVIKVLESEGFFFVSQRGSHAKYRKNGNPTRTVIVPIHGKEIPFGTFRSLVRQSKLKEELFIN